jgi:predicted enzyme related to lactoylglutathione lyase
MPDKTARGRFVWHELMVPDAAKAHEFYGKVVGWTTQPFEPNPDYQMFAASTGPLGGTVAQADGPPHWLPHLGSTDIDATLRQATDLGATVVTPVTDIPNGGRWARLTDPQGASFAVYQSSTKPAREKPPKRGEFSWHELMTTDYKAAFEFYSKVFGWEKAEEHDMGPLGMYFVFARNGVPLGGMFNAMPDMEGGPAWTGYVRVKDVHKVAKKAQKAGARLINGPMEVPGGDWIAQFVDPQGAMFAVHTLKADLAPPATTPAEAAPEQGSLDFPPVTHAPEKVAVLAKKPSAKVATPKPARAKAKRPAAKKSAAAKKPAAKKVAAKKAPAKKKAAGKKVSRKKSAGAKKVKKASRKVIARRPKKKARRAK